MNDNYGYNGPVPAGVSVEDNVRRALIYQATHTQEETFRWFYECTRSRGGKRQLSGPSHLDYSMDYGQLGGVYEDFGNFNYGVVGRALGISDYFLKKLARVAQRQSDGLSFLEAANRAWCDEDKNGDDPEGQILIEHGIDAARAQGHTEVNIVMLPLGDVA